MHSNRAVFFQNQGTFFFDKINVVFYIFQKTQGRPPPLVACLNRDISKSLKKDTAQKMKFSIQNFFSKCDQIRSFLCMWSHLLKKSLMENFIFCAVRNEPQAFLSQLNQYPHEQMCFCVLLTYLKLNSVAAEVPIIKNPVH